jgi:hypothetical protein
MSTSLKVPSIAKDCDAEWIEMRRAAIRRDGHAVRAGAGNSIELKSLTPRERLAEWDPLRLNAWVPICLPGGSGSFATTEDRDAVLAKLTEAP